MLTDGLVLRPRLTALMAGHTHVGIEAPAGYGKTTLAAEAAHVLGARLVWVPASPLGVAPTVAILRRAVRAARLGNLDVSPGADDLDATADALAGLLADTAAPVLVVLDDAHLTAPELARSLASAVSSPHCLAVLGRRAVAPGAPRRLLLTATDLAFTEVEVADLVGGDARAGEIWRSTAGWPAGVAAMIRAGSGAFGASSLTAWFDPLDADLRDVAATLARLPLITPLTADGVGGPGAWERLIDEGMPVVAEPDGRARIPRVVADAVAGRAPSRPELLVLGARALAEEGDILAGATVLVSAGDADGAAALLADVSPGAAEALDPAEWLALVDVLGPALDERPAVLLHVARALELSVQLEARAALLERAWRVAEGAVRRAVEAERIRDLVLIGEPDAARRRGQALLRELEVAGEGEHHTRIRLLGALGRLQAWAGDGAAAEELLQRAVALAGRHGDPSDQAQVLMWLGHTVHFEAGDRARAVQALERARDLCVTGSRRSALISILLAEIHAAFGDSAATRSALSLAAPVLASTTDQRLRAYAAWHRAAVAALECDAEEVRRALAEAERHPGEWFAHPTGVEFLAQSADLLRRVGDLDGARRALARALERVGGTELVDIVTAARGALEATDGDPVLADELLSQALASAEVPTRDRWRIELLRAAAARRRGDEAAATELHRRSRALRPDLTDDDVRRIEPSASALLLVEAGPAQPPPSPVAATPGRQIRMLGRFEVLDGEVEVTPVGQSASLLTYVALQRTVGVERTVDHFWPDADPEVGRRRLRNLLNRLRDQSPGFVERSGEALVVPPEVNIDIERFESMAQALLERDDTAAGLTALAMYRGALLPVELYDDWIDRQRSRLALRCCDVAERLASVLEASEASPRALMVLERALEVDPYDESRWLWAARLARDTGQLARAKGLLTGATAALAELGLAPGRELVSLGDSLDDVRERGE